MRFVQKSQFTFGDIESAACKYFQCSAADLRAKSPTQENCRRRFVVVHLARLLTPLSSTAIARRLGQVDHTTILNAERRAGELIQADAEFAMTVLGVAQLLFHTPPARERIRALFQPAATPAPLAASWV